MVHVRRNVVAYVALFFALSGSAAALSKGEVKSKHIAPRAVNTKHIAQLAVKTKQIEAGAVKAAQLAPGSIDASKVKGNSLTGEQIDESTLNLALDAWALPNAEVPQSTPGALAQREVTLKRAGRMLVAAQIPITPPTCVSGTGTCSAAYAIYVDDVGVPGTVLRVFDYHDYGPAQTVIGVTGELQAGTHTVQVKVRPDSNTASYGAGASQLVAVSLSN